MKNLNIINDEKYYNIFLQTLLLKFSLQYYTNTKFQKNFQNVDKESILHSYISHLDRIGILKGIGDENDMPAGRPQTMFD